jgi:hypothetical protein
VCVFLLFLRCAPDVFLNEKSFFTSVEEESESVTLAEGAQMCV